MVYEQEDWRVRLPDGWAATGGRAGVEIRKVGGVGGLKVYTTNAQPSRWDPGRELFHGQLYGFVGLWPDQKTHGWKLWCGNVSVYIYYSWKTFCERELAEVHEIVFSLSPRKWV